MSFETRSGRLTWIRSALHPWRSDRVLEAPADTDVPILRNPDDLQCS